MGFNERGVLTVLIVLVGIAGASYFIRTKPVVEHTIRTIDAPAVEVMIGHEKTEPIRVNVWGTVIPAQQIILIPQVTGRVVQQDKRLVPGGRFAKGEVMLTIDPRDYLNAIQQAQAAQVQAEFSLRVEQGRQVVAKKEWALLKDELGDHEASRSLALREPHLANAKASLRSAESALKQAKLNLSRATLHAPFNALVQEETVDPGQLISTQSRLATLVGTDRYWVQVSVPADKLDHIFIPGVNAQKGTASTAEIIHETRTGQRHVWRGKVVRLRANLEPAGRMARLLVAVDDPLGLTKPMSERRPLLLGTYVQVALSAAPFTRAVAIPRRALHDGDVIYILKDHPTAPEFLPYENYRWQALMPILRAPASGAGSPLARLIWDQLSAKGRAKILAAKPTAAPDAALGRDLRSALNVLLTSTTLASRPNWNEEKLTTHCAALLAQHHKQALPTKKLRQLNRMLLSHAFPHALPRWPYYTLEIRSITPRWRRKDAILLQSPDLKQGERLIISRIAVPMPGKLLSWDGFLKPDTKSPPTKTKPSREIR